MLGGALDARCNQWCTIQHDRDTRRVIRYQRFTVEQVCSDGQIEEVKSYQ